MPDQKVRRTLVILNLLGVYILLQVCWWGYLVIAASKRLAFTEGQDTDTARQVWMIVGEGSVFLTLLFIGFWSIRRNIRRELHFANVQRTFLLAVTHELKTPVAAIKLQMETLHTRNVSPDQAQKLIAASLKETNRLEGLVGNILLVTRLDQERMGATSYAINLSDVLSNELNRFSSLFQLTRKISHELTSGVEITGEPELIRAVCFNLIDNAVKYSGEGGHVQVRLYTTGNMAKIEVSDNGSGIPDEEKKRIFHKFYRPGNELTRQHKGTGLGLYIVQNAVKLHHGSIRVEDARPNGTRFIVSLPLHHAE